MGDQTRDQEQLEQVKKLKRSLEGWRIALLSLKSIILWEEQWHPCALVGCISFLYLFIWFLDLNTLASFAIVGLIFNFLDFIVPVICNQLYGTNSWTGKDEKSFEEICKSIVIHYNKIKKYIGAFYSLRETSVFVYYIISITMLCTIAWLSSSINNIFLLYILSTVMLLWPGVQHRGIFSGVFALAPKIPFLKSE